MYIDVYACNVCGTEKRPPADLSKWVRFKTEEVRAPGATMARVKFFHLPKSVDEFDLCETCAEKLKLWFEEQTLASAKP